eukprot:1495162-Prymnesium_polylepis.1
MSDEQRVANTTQGMTQPRGSTSPATSATPREQDTRTSDSPSCRCGSSRPAHVNAEAVDAARVVAASTYTVNARARCGDTCTHQPPRRIHHGTRDA